MSDFAGLSPEAILLGWLDPLDRGGRTGAPAAARPDADDSVTVIVSQEAHLLTIAPNRSGRDRACIIPNLRTYTGQVVVLDLDGKAYAATAEARRAMGHTVVRLDPFGVTGPEPDSFDPIDWIDNTALLESASQDIAALLSPGNSSDDADEQEAIGLLSAIIGYLYVVPEKHFDDLYSTLHSDDVVYSLAVVLDTIGKKLPKRSYSEIANFLKKETRVRSRTLARATSIIKGLGITEVQKSLHGSTFAFPSQDPVTVYLVMPLERLALHAALLRLWIGTFLLHAVRSREEPSQPTLFLLDHCAELGAFPLLESLLTIESPGAFRIWTFWHDVHQLRTTYPRNWPAIVGGCGAVQLFGTRDPAAAGEAEALLGLPGANDVGSLGPGEQIVRVDSAPCRARRLDSRDDVARSAAVAGAMPATGR